MSISNREAQDQVKEVARQYGLTQFTVFVFSASVVAFIWMAVAVEYFNSPVNTQIPVQPDATETDQQNLARAALALQQFLRVGAITIAFIALPMLISYAFTMLHQAHRLIPPLFIQLVAFSFLIAYLLLRFPGTQSGLATIGIVGFVGLGMVGWFQDRFMIKALGYFIDSDQMETRFLKVEGKTVVELQRKLLEPPIRHTLYLKRRTEQKAESVFLKTLPTADYVNYIELRQNPLDNSVSMSFVFFEKGAYFIKTSPELREHADKTVAYIIMRFTDLDTVLTPNHSIIPDSTIVEATEDLSGLSSRGFTTAEKAVLLIGLAAFGLPIAYVLQNLEKPIGGDFYGLVMGAVGIYAAMVAGLLGYKRGQQKREKD